MSQKARGTLLVCISGIAFGTYAFFALRAGEAGFGTISLLFYRFALAVLILSGIAVFSRAKLPDRSSITKLIGLGGLYVGQSFTYLQCLRASNPITASLLLYLYPAFVTAGSVLFLHEKLTATKMLALGCAFAGSMLIISPIASVTGAAVGYGFATALFYAAYLVAGKRVLRDTPALASTLVILSTAAIVYGSASLVIGFDVPLTPRGWIWPVCLAVVATVVAIGGLLWGLRYISPVEASSLSALEPLVTALIAVTLLSQPLRAGHVVGGLLVILAVIVLARKAAVTKAER